MVPDHSACRFAISAELRNVGVVKNAAMLRRAGADRYPGAFRWTGAPATGSPSCCWSRAPPPPPSWAPRSGSARRRSAGTSTRCSPTARGRPASGPCAGPRGRGRPAKVFALTDAGAGALRPHTYDDLATAALRWIAAHGGAGGGRRVRRRAGRRRWRSAAGRRWPSAGDDPLARAEALAEALTAEGYAASASTIATGGQLCQHHCPVAHVAAEFPQLCEAETAGHLPPGRHARAAPGHHRPRRRGLHHAHPDASAIADRPL